MTSKTPLICLFIAGDVEVDAFFGYQVPKDSKTLDHWNYWRQHNLIILHTGIGALNAACAAYTSLKTFQPTVCLQIGLSGSHLEQLDIGAILLSKAIKNFSRHTKTATGDIQPRLNLIQMGGNCHTLESFEAEPELLKDVGELLKSHGFSFQEAVVGSADQFNRDPQFIQKIQNSYGTWCEDMESAAVAHAAFRWNIPFLSIRIISNNELTEQGQSVDGKRFEEKAFHQLTQLGQLLLQESNILV